MSRRSNRPLVRWFDRPWSMSLRRVTTSTKFIPQIDGLRFVAIVLVLISHVSNEGQRLIDRGWLARAIDRRPLGIRGVDLFFTLSGFVLALPYARHHLQDARPVDIAAYFRRRITRLEPPFLIAMLGRLILFLSFSSASTGVIFTHFFAGLFYLHSAIYGTASMVNLPSWSLEIEVQFYLVAPLLALLFCIRHTSVRRTVLVGVVLVTAFLSQTPAFANSQRISLSLLGNVQFFLAGFLVCDLYVLRDSLRGRSWLWDVAALAVFPLAIWSLNDWFWITLPVANILLCVAALFGRMLPRLLALSFVSIVGGMCYSIYLTHNTVFLGVHAVLARISLLTSHPAAFNAAMFATALTAGLGVGTLFFIVIERPCMDPAWPSKLKARLMRVR